MGEAEISKTVKSILLKQIADKTKPKLWNRKTKLNRGQMIHEWKTWQERGGTHKGAQWMILYSALRKQLPLADKSANPTAAESHFQVNVFRNRH